MALTDCRSIFKLIYSYKDIIIENIWISSSQHSGLQAQLCLQELYFKDYVWHKLIDALNIMIHNNLNLNCE